MKTEAGSLLEGRFHAAWIERLWSALPLTNAHMEARHLKVKENRPWSWFEAC